jgi:hypothetical protein
MDNSAELANVRKYQSQLRSFVKETKLYRQSVREQVAGYSDKSISIKTSEKQFNKSDYLQIADKDMTTSSSFAKRYQELSTGKYTEDEITYLRDYSRFKYKDINGVARGEIEAPEIGEKFQTEAWINPNEGLDILGISEPTTIFKSEIYDVNSAIRNIDSAIDKAAGIPENVVLHRGFGSEDIYNLIKNNKIIPGSKFQDKAFMSTSWNSKVAESFSSKNNPVLLEIYADKGSKGIYFTAEKFSSFENETEILLPRNAKLNVISSEIIIDNYGRSVAKIVARYK